MADNQVQQRDADVVTYTSFAGVRNDVAPERFSNADMETATNCVLDKSGRVSRRDGLTKQSVGAYHSLWSDDLGTMALIIGAGQLKQLNADYTMTGLHALTDGLARMSYVKVNDSVYFSNGVDTGVLHDGAVRSWGVAVPTLPGVSLLVGSMPAGTYQFTMTYLREDGQESGAPLAGVIQVPAGGGLAFTLPVATDPTITRKTIYLSTPNGDEMYAAGTVPNSTTSAGYAGDALELNLPLESQFLQPPPAGQLVAYYRGRLLVAVGDTIYSSEPFSFERFDLRTYIQLDGRIVLMAPMEDKESSDPGMHSGIFVGTDRSCGVIVGSSPEGSQYVPKTTYGAILGALDYVDGSVFGDNSIGARPLPMWLTPQGICVGKPDMEIQNLTRTKFGFTAAGQGAAIFIPGPNRFIASSNF